MRTCVLCDKNLKGNIVRVASESCSGHWVHPGCPRGFPNASIYVCPSCNSWSGDVLKGCVVEVLVNGVWDGQPHLVQGENLVFIKPVEGLECGIGEDGVAAALVSHEASAIHSHSTSKNTTGNESVSTPATPSQSSSETNHAANVASSYLVIGNIFEVDLDDEITEALQTPSNEPYFPMEPEAPSNMLGNVRHYDDVRDNSSHGHRQEVLQQAEEINHFENAVHPDDEEHLRNCDDVHSVRDGGTLNPNLETLSQSFAHARHCETRCLNGARYRLHPYYDHSSSYGVTSGSVQEHSSLDARYRRVNRTSRANVVDPYFYDESLYDSRFNQTYRQDQSPFRAGCRTTRENNEVPLHYSAPRNYDFGYPMADSRFRRGRVRHSLNETHYSLEAPVNYEVVRRHDERLAGWRNNAILQDRVDDQYRRVDANFLDHFGIPQQTSVPYCRQPYDNIDRSAFEEMLNARSSYSTNEATTAVRLDQRLYTNSSGPRTAVHLGSEMSSSENTGAALNEATNQGGMESGHNASPNGGGNQRRVSPSENTKEHVCDICQKKFTTRQGKSRCKERHSFPPKSFPCTFPGCSHKSTRRDNLTTPVKISHS